MATLLIISENLHNMNHWYDALDSEHSLFSVSNTDEIVCFKKYDLVVLDQIMVQDWQSLTQLKPHIRRILVVGDQWSDNKKVQAIIDGACGYSEKKPEIKTIVKTVSSVLKGELWLQRNLIQKVFQKQAADVTFKDKRVANFLPKEDILELSCLTHREFEVVELIYQGYAISSIATNMDITERTVKAHLSSIFKKLHVKDRYQLVVFLKNHHLGSLNPDDQD